MFTKNMHAQQDGQRWHRFTHEISFTSTIVSSHKRTRSNCRSLYPVEMGNSYSSYAKQNVTSNLTSYQENINKKSLSDKKQVTFSSIEIRTHSIIVGDHPSCSLPLSLDWAYVPESIDFPIEVYESERGPRKRRNELKMTYFERKHRLKSIAGMNDGEILLAIASST